MLNLGDNCDAIDIFYFIYFLLIHPDELTHLSASYIADEHILPRVLKYDMISIDTN